MVSYPRIFIAAGEHSGDRFGASLAEALRRLSPDVRLTGVGGPRMAAAGVRVVADTVGHSGMGLLSAFGNAQRWVRVFRNCIREFNREPPDILVPVDNPGFNLRLAGHARARKIPVCYYVSPQVWAWMPHRIHRIARLVTRMMTILPFEKALYDPLGVDCRYVGHPVLDYMAPAVMDSAVREKYVGSLGARGKTVVGLLPGSRSQEIRHTFPILCDAAAILRRRNPDILFLGRRHVRGTSARPAKHPRLQETGRRSPPRRDPADHAGLEDYAWPSAAPPRWRPPTSAPRWSSSIARTNGRATSPRACSASRTSAWSTSSPAAKPSPNS